MKTRSFNAIAVILALSCYSQTTIAQHNHGEPELHVNPRWSECSFQLDPSLTQEAWHDFTKEAGLVGYFRPLTSAKPMGAWHFEISALQWQTAFDDSKPAWNDTFVHPDSAHWLKETSRLAFPGLTARVGITDKLDVGLFFTKNPGANYGFAGGQLQYGFLNNSKWSAAARANFNMLFGPEDLKLNIYGVEGIVSREIKIYSSWLSVSPYVGVSSYLSSTRETTEAVNLQDENVIGGQAMVGAVLKLSAARVGVEYNFASVSTLSFKIGVAF
jgi:hypothetical protein